MKDLYNAKLVPRHAHTVEFSGDGMVEKKIQWVSTDYVEVEVLKPHDLLTDEGNYNEKSLERISGYAENGILELKIGEIVQFERFGFCRLDSKSGKKLIFVYSC